MNFVNQKKVNITEMPVRLQVFANIRYYFDWIDEMTGLQMPKCRRSLLDYYEYDD